MHVNTAASRCHEAKYCFR